MIGSKSKRNLTEAYDIQDIKLYTTVGEKASPIGEDLEKQVPYEFERKISFRIKITHNPYKL